jgi:hypothetical protein
LAVTDLNTLVVQRLESSSQYVSKVCDFDPVSPIKCFKENQIEAVEKFELAQWEIILYLDWYVFDFLKTADDKTVEAFGFDTGVDPKQRWYKDIDAASYLLMSSLDDIDLYWTLECNECLS